MVGVFGIRTEGCVYFAKLELKTTVPHIKCPATLVINYSISEARNKKLNFVAKGMFCRATLRRQSRLHSLIFERDLKLMSLRIIFSHFYTSPP